jgi:uncharacterized protein YuzB (UPF0349 family)
MYVISNKTCHATDFWVANSGGVNRFSVLRNSPDKPIGTHCGSCTMETLALWGGGVVESSVEWCLAPIPINN